MASSCVSKSLLILRIFVNYPYHDTGNFVKHVYPVKIVTSTQYTKKKPSLISLKIGLLVTFVKNKVLRLDNTIPKEKVGGIIGPVKLFTLIIIDREKLKCLYKYKM